MMELDEESCDQAANFDRAHVFLTSQSGVISSVQSTCNTLKPSLVQPVITFVFHHYADEGLMG